MTAELLLLILTVLVLLIASYSDLKTKEVPDWLNYGFVFAAVGVRAIYSFQNGWSFLITGLLGLAVAYLLALLFYYTHQWGGGDSKLLMGMGAAIGIAYPFNGSSFTMLWFLLSLLFSGAVYGLVWLLVVALKKRSCLAPELRSLLGRHKKIHLGVGFASLVLFSGGMFISALLYVLVLMVALYYLLLFLVAVQYCCFVSEQETKSLVEGDWLAEDVVVHGKTIVKKKTLHKEDIQKLRDKNISSVTIKEGIPFVPSFLIAYLLLMFGKIFTPVIVRSVLG